MRFPNTAKVIANECDTAARQCAAALAVWDDPDAARRWAIAWQTLEGCMWDELTDDLKHWAA